MDSNAKLSHGLGFAAFGLILIGAALTLDVVKQLWPEGVLPTPYKNVRVVEHRIEDEWFYVTASFEKTACTLRRFEVVGGALGISNFLEFEDLDGLATNHDRTVGAQTLRVKIYIDHRNYEWIELRTQHDCDGAGTAPPVNGVFARFEDVFSGTH